MSVLAYDLCVGVRVTRLRVYAILVGRPPPSPALPFPLYLCPFAYMLFPFWWYLMKVPCRPNEYAPPVIEVRRALVREVSDGDIYVRARARACVCLCVSVGVGVSFLCCPTVIFVLLMSCPNVS